MSSKTGGNWILSAPKLSFARHLASGQNIDAHSQSNLVELDSDIQHEVYRLVGCRGKSCQNGTDASGLC